MEVVTCYCLKCNGELGRFRNSWNGVGNTYFSPVHAALSLRGLEVTGKVYQAAKGSQIENSLLQDVACHKCRVVLGLRCDSSPEGHILQKDQLILRLSEMSVISEGSGRIAKISVLKTFALKSAHSKLLTSKRASTAQPSARSLPQKAQASSSFTQSITGRSTLHQEAKRKSLSSGRVSVHPDISRRSSAASRSQPQSNSLRRASLNDINQVNQYAQTELDNFKTWAKEEISSQKIDIERITGKLERIEGDLRSLKDFMKEVREEIGLNRQTRPNKHSDDQKTLRKDIDELILRVKNNEKRRTQPNSPALNALNRKFDNIAEDVLKIGGKAQEVDDIKTILVQLRERMRQLESTTSRPALPPAPSLKQKYDHEREIWTPSPVEQSTELPSKRRKVGTIVHRSDSDDSLNLEPQISSERQVISLVSSNAPSPILGSDDYTAPRFDESIDSRLQEKSAPQVVVYVSRPKSTESLSRRTDSLHPRVINPPTSEPKTSREPNIEEASQRRRSEISYLRNKEPVIYQVTDLALGRKRDSTGRLLRGDGRIDRRSLRPRTKPSNETSVSREEQPLEQAFEPPPPPPPAVLTSVEKDDDLAATTYPWKCATCTNEFASKLSLASHESNCNTIPTPSIADPVSCQACGKTWKTEERYLDHECVQVQKDAEIAKETEVDTRIKQVKLAARERLVRETLERELG